MSSELGRPPGRYFTWVALIAVLAMAVRIPAVFVGLMSDDFMQHGMIAGLYPGDGYAPFDLYAFLRAGETMVAHVEQGTAPWWSAADLHGTVLRPIASLLLWLDHTLAPGRVELWHLHSLLWFGAAVVGFGLVVRRLLPTNIALVAVVLFGLDAGVVSPLGWLANRCVLVCATFGLLALYTHLEWRAPQSSTPAWLRRFGPLIEAGLVLLCIGAGEYGLAIVAYIFAWELVVATAGSPARARVRTLARALGPAALPIGAYLVVHKLLGYGTFGAEVYVDPFHTPTGYLSWAVTRIPELVAAGFWSIPASTIHVFRFGPLTRFESWLVPDGISADEYHAVHVRVAVASIVLAVAIVVIIRRGLEPQERQNLRALVLGGLLGLLPIAVAPPHSRLLVLAQLGACTPVAAVLVATVRLLRRSAIGDRVRGALAIPLAVALAGSHTVGDLRWGQAYLEYIDHLQAQNLAAFIRGDLLGPDLAGADVVVLNAPSQSIGLFGPFVLDAYGWPAPHSWRPLVLGGEFAIFATRSGPRSLELAPIQGAWMHTAGELFFRRADQPLERGDVITHPSLRVEILASVDGHPTRVRFEFDRPLEQLLFVTATPDGLRRWTVPRVGRGDVIPIPHLPLVDDLDEVVFPAYRAARTGD